MVGLPTGVWVKIAEKVDKNVVFSFAMTCKQLREAQQVAGRKLETKTEWKDEDGNTFVEEFTHSWCWFHTRRFNISETRADIIKAVNTVAASEGYLDVLKHWEDVPADKKKFLWDEVTCMWAASKGHLDVLKYLRSQGCPWDEITCDMAAWNGHLEVLKWSRSQGCPWDEFTCASAAGKGHLEILKWVRSQGCPWSQKSCTWAAQFGHLETLKWLRGQNPPCPWDKSDCLFWARSNSHFVENSHVVDWINSQP